MTTETRIIIDLDDIMAVEFECKKCHARLSVAINEFNDAAYRCPSCGADWIRTAGGPTDVAVRQMIGYLKAVKEMPSKDIPLGMTVRFQISSSVRASSGKD